MVSKHDTKEKCIDDDTSNSSEDINIKEPGTIPPIEELKMESANNTPAATNEIRQMTLGKQIPVPPPGATLVIPPAATIAGGSTSQVYLQDILKMIPQDLNIPPQKGLSQRSVLLCPNIYFYDHYTVQGKKQVI